LKNVSQVRVSQLMALCVLFAGMLLANMGAFAVSFGDPLVDAADRGNKRDIQAMLSDGYGVDNLGEFGVTALMRSSYRGYRDIVVLLLQANADVGLEDVGGETALHLAARQGHVSVARLLIDYGADVDMADNEQWTPLMRAVVNDKYRMVQELIKHHADIWRTNRQHYSAMSYAVMYKRYEIVELLSKTPQIKEASAQQRDDMHTLARSHKNPKMLELLERVLSRMPKDPVFPEGSSLEEETFVPKKQESALQRLIVGDAKPKVNVPTWFSSKKEVKKSVVEPANEASILSKFSEVSINTGETEKRPDDNEIQDALQRLRMQMLRSDQESKFVTTQTLLSSDEMLLNLVEEENDHPVQPQTDLSLVQTIEGVAEVRQKQQRKDLAITAKAPQKSLSQKVAVQPINKFEVGSSVEQQLAKNVTVIEKPQPKERSQLVPAQQVVANIKDSMVYSVQLGVFDAIPAALAKWHHMQNAAYDVLGAYAPYIKKAQLAGSKRVFYRLRVGAFGTREQAQDLCDGLKLGRMDCFVVKMSKLDIDKATRKTANLDVEPKLSPVSKKKEVVKAKPIKTLTPAIKKVTLKPTKKLSVSKGKKDVKRKANVPDSKVPLASSDFTAYFIPVPKVKPVIVPDAQDLAVVSVPNGKIIDDMPWKQTPVVPSVKKDNKNALPTNNAKLAVGVSGPSKVEKQMPVPLIPRRMSDKKQPAKSASKSPVTRPLMKTVDVASDKKEKNKNEQTQKQQKVNEPVQATVKEAPVVDDLPEPVEGLPWKKEVPVASGAQVPVPAAEVSRRRNQVKLPSPEPKEVPKNNKKVASELSADGSVAYELARQKVRSKFLGKKENKNKLMLDEFKAEYEAFYKQIERELNDPDLRNNKVTSVSEAVLVPDASYERKLLGFGDDEALEASKIHRSRQAAHSSSGSTAMTRLKIGPFNSERHATDYYSRMFKYNQSYQRVPMMLMMPRQKGGRIFMQLGPMGEDLSRPACDMVRKNAFTCDHIDAEGSRIFGKSKKPSNGSYWLELGTFATSSQAEYYWMSLKQDHANTLEGIGMQLKATHHGAFGGRAKSLRAGPVSTKSEANQLCHRLRAVRAACVVR